MSNYVHFLTGLVFIKSLSINYCIIKHKPFVISIIILLLFNLLPANINATYTICGTNRFCYNISVYNTSTTVQIQDIDRNADTYFDINFIPIDKPCINPKISFTYEQIDVAGSDEYIDVYDNGTLIQRCQGNGGPNHQCGIWWQCINTTLDINQINVGTSYQVELVEARGHDARCSSHSYSINAILTLTCSS